MPQAVSNLQAVSEPGQLQMYLEDVVYENVELCDPLTKHGLAIMYLYMTQNAKCNTFKSNAWTRLIANWKAVIPAFGG